MMNRRAFIRSAAALIAAPAIVRATSLMPVRAFAFEDGGFLVPPEIAAALVRQFEIDEICRIFRVPVHMIGEPIRGTTSWWGGR